MSIFNKKKKWKEPIPPDGNIKMMLCAMRGVPNCSSYLPFISYKGKWYELSEGDKEYSMGVYIDKDWYPIVLMNSNEEYSYVGFNTDQILKNIHNILMNKLEELKKIME